MAWRVFVEYDASVTASTNQPVTASDATIPYHGCWYDCCVRPPTIARVNGPFTQCVLLLSLGPLCVVFLWLGMHAPKDALVKLKLSERVEAAEAAAALLKEELVETRQAVSWREEEVVKMRKANAESEVCDAHAMPTPW